MQAKVKLIASGMKSWHVHLFIRKKLSNLKLYNIQMQLVYFFFYFLLLLRKSIVEAFLEMSLARLRNRLHATQVTAAFCNIIVVCRNSFVFFENFNFVEICIWNVCLAWNSCESLFSSRSLCAIQIVMVNTGNAFVVLILCHDSIYI